MKLKVLITSGGCKAPIDAVRHIGNFSSGRFGSELAREIYLKGGSDVIFFHEKGSQTPFSEESTFNHTRAASYQAVEYKDYNDYLTVKDLISLVKPDVIISAAAISDYIPVPVEGKISSSEEEITITLKKGEKVISSFRDIAPNALIVGFKLLVGPTENEIESAVDKVFNSSADLVVFNDLIKLKKGDVTRRLYYSKTRTDFGDQRYIDANDAKQLSNLILAAESVLNR